MISKLEFLKAVDAVIADGSDIFDLSELRIVNENEGELSIAWGLQVKGVNVDDAGNRVVATLDARLHFGERPDISRVYFRGVLYYFITVIVRLDK